MKIKPQKYTSIKELVHKTATPEEKEFVDAFDRLSRERQITKHLMGLRVAQDKSQADMAAAMGCTQSRISKLEGGIDDDLRLGDLRSYLDALGLAPKLVVMKKGNLIVDSIKYYWHCLGQQLDRLLDLARNDSEIAVGIGKFSNELTFHYFSRIVDFINRLPQAAKQEAPSIGIQVEDFMVDDCESHSEHTRDEHAPCTHCGAASS